MAILHNNINIIFSEVMNRGDILGLVQVITSSNMSRKNNQMDIVNIADVKTQQVGPENLIVHKVNHVHVQSKKRNIGIILIPKKWILL